MKEFNLSAKIHNGHNLRWDFIKTSDVKEFIKRVTGEQVVTTNIA